MIGRLRGFGAAGGTLDGINRFQPLPFAATSAESAAVLDTGDFMVLEVDTVSSELVEVTVETEGRCRRGSKEPIIVRNARIGTTSASSAATSARIWARSQPWKRADSASSAPTIAAGVQEVALVAKDWEEEDEDR